MLRAEWNLAEGYARVSINFEKLINISTVVARSL